MELRWLRRALRELDTIATYVGRDNPEAAVALMSTIRQKTAELAAFPYLGRASEIGDVRELVIHAHYLISYRIRPGRVEILQVWHTARNRST
jgi:addiction module RelE/StbE family toxin